jgi:hypothetical protein
MKKKNIKQLLSKKSNVSLGYRFISYWYNNLSN